MRTALRLCRRTRCWPRRSRFPRLDRAEPGRHHHRSPVLALMLLALALAADPARAAIVRAASAGAVLGIACDMKSTAWLAVRPWRRCSPLATASGRGPLHRRGGAHRRCPHRPLAPATLFRREAAAPWCRTASCSRSASPTTKRRPRACSRAPARRDGHGRARSLGWPATRGRPGRRDLTGDQAAARPIRGLLAPGDRLALMFLLGPTYVSGISSIRLACSAGWPRTPAPGS